MTREELIQAIGALENHRLPELERDRLLLALVRAVPHASISNLIYYPERDRSQEQIVEEALLRERLWADGGDSAVRRRVEGQMHAALADPTLPESHHTKISARRLLEASEPDRLQR